jgi:hypothetical protein
MTNELKRREMLRDGAIGAARQYLAAVLVRERRIGLADMTAEEADHLQTLRDSLTAERRARMEVARV